MPAEHFGILVAKGRDHGLEAAKSAVQAERDEHQEEDDGPEDRALHRGDRFRIHYEHQSRP